VFEIERHVLYVVDTGYVKMKVRAVLVAVFLL